MDPIRADKPYRTIAGDDIGAFVALAFERPKEFIGEAPEIACSELTNLHIFGRVLGKKLRFRRLAFPIVPPCSRERVLPDVPLVQSCLI
jgi:hypothetical protein